MYLYGRQFTLVTDHKPLMACNPWVVPSLAAARLQRWACLRNPIQTHGNADADYP